MYGINFCGSNILVFGELVGVVDKLGDGFGFIYCVDVVWGYDNLMLLLGFGVVISWFLGDG